MDKGVKVVMQFLDIIFGSIVSLAIFDMTPQGNQLLSEVSDWVKLVVSIIGIIYFILMGPYRKRMRKETLNGVRLDNKIKRETLEKLEKENNK